MHFAISFVITLLCSWYIYMSYFNNVSVRTATQHFSQNVSRASLSLLPFIPYFKLIKCLTPFSRYPQLFNYYSYLMQVFILRLKLNFIRSNYLPSSLVLGDSLNFSAGALTDWSSCAVRCGIAWICFNQLKHSVFWLYLMQPLDYMCGPKVFDQTIPKMHEIAQPWRAIHDWAFIH